MQTVFKACGRKFLRVCLSWWRTYCLFLAVMHFPTSDFELKNINARILMTFIIKTWVKACSLLSSNDNTVGPTIMST